MSAPPLAARGRRSEVDAVDVLRSLVVRSARGAAAGEWRPDE